MNRFEIFGFWICMLILVALAAGFAGLCIENSRAHEACAKRCGITEHFIDHTGRCMCAREP